MSETRSQQEPSMEEILASIRRIISEDGQEPQKETQAGAKPNPAETSDPSPAKPAQAGEKPADGKPTGDKAERPRLRAVPSGDGEILVLTEMVAEDGSVVSLAEQSAAGPDLSAAPETPGLPEPPDDLEATQATVRKTPDAGRAASEEKAPEKQPEAKAVGPQAGSAPTINTDDEMENDTMSNDARKKLELVSQEAEAASTAALAELARTVSRDRDLPVDGGRSVEALVREALEPMLRQWLDAHLPELVERIVRSEVQRMVRRAEDKA